MYQQRGNYYSVKLILMDELFQKHSGEHGKFIVYFIHHVHRDEVLLRLFVVCFFPAQAPNASHEPMPEAGATQERML